MLETIDPLGTDLLRRMQTGRSTMNLFPHHSKTVAAFSAILVCVLNVFAMAQSSPASDQSQILTDSVTSALRTQIGQMLSKNDAGGVIRSMRSERLESPRGQVIAGAIIEYDFKIEDLPLMASILSAADVWWQPRHFEVPSGDMKAEEFQTYLAFHVYGVIKRRQSLEEMNLPLLSESVDRWLEQVFAKYRNEVDQKRAKLIDEALVKVRAVAAEKRTRPEWRVPGTKPDVLNMLPDPASTATPAAAIPASVTAPLADSSQPAAVNSFPIVQAVWIIAIAAASGLVFFILRRRKEPQ